MQESDSPSEESDVSRMDSDASSYSSRHGVLRGYKRPRRPRMSIRWNQYTDAATDFASWQYENGPAAKSSRRRFFTSGARWDETVEDVLRRREDANPLSRTLNGKNAGTNVAGRAGEPENMEEDWVYDGQT